MNRRTPVIGPACGPLYGLVVRQLIGTRGVLAIESRKLVSDQGRPAAEAYAGRLAAGLRHRLGSGMCLCLISITQPAAPGLDSNPDAIARWCCGAARQQDAAADDQF